MRVINTPGHLGARHIFTPLTRFRAEQPHSQMFETPGKTADPASQHDPFQKFHIPGGRTAMNIQMADLYTAMFERGIQTWKRLTNLAKEDQILGREMAEDSRGARLPLVRLPANYEAW